MFTRVKINLKSWSPKKKIAYQKTYANSQPASATMVYKTIWKATNIESITSKITHKMNTDVNRDCFLSKKKKSDQF